MLTLTRMTHVIALYYDIKLISGETVVVLLLRSLWPLRRTMRQRVK